jgi:hypothetical protein
MYIGLLVPVIKKDKYQCCYFVQLPYEDDIRNYHFSSLPIGNHQGISKAMLQFAPSPTQLQSAMDFVKGLQLVAEDEDG